MNNNVAQTVRETLSMLAAAEARCERITRPEIPAIKQSGRYSFVIESRVRAGAK